MHAKTVIPQFPTIPVSKDDLIAAWSVLEKVVVSLRKIGSAYATQPTDTGEHVLELRQRELEALSDFFSPELLRELSRARRVLAEYLPADESESISQNEIQFWSAGDAKPQKH